MATINIEYDDQSVTVTIIRPNCLEECLYVDKHTYMSDLADMLYVLMDKVAASYSVEMEEYDEEA